MLRISAYKTVLKTIPKTVLLSVFMLLFAVVNGMLFPKDHDIRKK